MKGKNVKNEDYENAEDEKQYSDKEEEGKIVKIDSNSVFYLHPKVNPSTPMISIKLEGESNYIIWSKVMTKTLNNVKIKKPKGNSKKLHAWS